MTPVRNAVRLAMALAGILLGPALSLAAERPERSVLVLDQSSVGLPFNTALATAIRLSLNADSATPISFYLEHLDANRFPGPEYEDNILSFFKRKYFERRIDVIVTVGTAALDFVLRRGAEVWPGVPVTFAAIDSATVSQLTLPPNMTGVTMQLTLQDMVTAARIAVPNLKRIAIVGDPLERQTFFRHFQGRNTGHRDAASDHRPAELADDRTRETPWVAAGRCCRYLHRHLL